jgi:hypothetical protein
MENKNKTKEQRNKKNFDNNFDGATQWQKKTSLIKGDNIRELHAKSTLVVEGNDKRISYAKIRQTIKGDDTWANYLNNT